MTADHDPVMLAFAVVVCVGSVIAALRVYRQALQAQRQRRLGLIALSGLCSAGGLWATHFIAILAYQPAGAATFAAVTTTLSFAAAGIAMVIGLLLAAQPSRLEIATGGAVIGCGIGAMHFIGMAALDFPGSLSWDRPVVAIAVGLCVILAIAAMWSLNRWKHRWSFVAAVAGLVTAVLVLHLMAMSAVQLVAGPAAATGSATLGRQWLSLAVALVASAVLSAGFAAMTIGRLRRAVSDQLTLLEREITERRTAQRSLQLRQASLMSHQKTLTELVRDTSISTGDLDAAMQVLVKALSRELDICRVGYLLLGADGVTVTHRGVFDKARQDLDTPPFYGNDDHVAGLKLTSAHHLVSVEDTNIPGPFSVFKDKYYARLGIVASLHVPIMTNAQVAGFLTCAFLRKRERGWSEEDKVFALGVGNLAAGVVERHQRLAVEARAKATAQRLARQHDIVKQLIGSNSMRSGQTEELFRDIAAVICQEFKVDRVSVRFFGGAGIDQTYAVAYRNGAKTLKHEPRAAGAYPPVLAAAIAQGPIVIADTANDPLVAELYETSLKARRIRAMLQAPIRSEAGLVGVISCAVYDRPRRWQAEDEMFATSMANLFALAYERRLRLVMEESLRKANAEADEASKAKTMFLANMSHEIRTPMNGVLGMADLLSRSGLNERQQRLVATINDSARSLLAIINDILDISRIEGGKLELEQHDFELGACIEDAAEMLAEQACKRGIDLNLFVEDSVAGTVRSDPVRLRQVLVNLIGNAIKFTERGEVSVSVLPAAGPGQIRFTVRDSGIGIEPQVLDKLFQPFAQADTSITRRFGGTGLGLAISRQLVEMMGGRLHIESAPKLGTTISFELPLVVTAPPGQRADRGTLEGRRVLIVDDRETNREIISSYLATAGAVIQAVANNDAAMSVLHKAADAGEPIELAVVDLIMDGGDGLQLAQAIKSSPRLASTRIVLLSSLAWSTDLGDARSAGLDRVLSKPIRRRELVEAALGCLSTRNTAPGAPEAARHAPEALPRLGLKVLVAEDNPVNQVVAEEYLANLGCEAVIVENGRQALDALERQTFDVVLMDCQMPELDGYSATRERRMAERRDGLPSLPIIAVTANAYDSDRERCLEAGMTSYLSKPYSEPELAAALEMIRRPAAPQQPAAAIGTMKPGLRDKLKQTYRRHVAAAWPALERGMESNDLTAVALLAHSLKSSSANVGEVEIATFCSVLEAAARTGNAARCGEIMARVAPLLEAVATSDIARAAAAS